jgi:hypothetical protein
MRTVLRFLYANLALGLVVTAVSVALAPTDPATLTRAGIWVVAGLAYLRIARRLHDGVHSAYTRMRVLAAVGVVAVGWLVVADPTPVVLRVLHVGQVGLLAGLTIALNRPSVRVLFPKPAPRERRGNRKAALLLAVLAPASAELTLGTVSWRMAWIMLLYVPIYGAGALFIREIVRRTGRGWPSLLLMGLVYGLVEEGLALQSLTSPHLYGAADWAPRILGVNTAYAELNLPYHAVFSVALPVVLVELRFPARPYLGRGGLIGTGIVALLGVALIRISVPPAEDPGYALPLTALIVLVGLIVGLTVIALRLPPVTVQAVRPPRPPVVGLFAAAAVIGYLGLIWPFGGGRSAWAFLPMTVAALLGLCAALVLARWSAALVLARWSAAWTAQHRLAAVIGALLAHTVFGLFTAATSTVDRFVLAGLGVLEYVLGRYAARRLDGWHNSGEVVVSRAVLPTSSPQ